MRKTFYPPDHLSYVDFVYAYTRHEGRWVLSLHGAKSTWENPGGHVESGETPLAAMTRELIEETGAMDFTLTPVWDYEQDGFKGRVYYAEIPTFGPIPQGSEMTKVGFFHAFPEDLSYDRMEMVEESARALRLTTR